MAPDSWWRGTLAVGCIGLGSLITAAFAPLLSRAFVDPPPGVSGHLDLFCLFFPTASDWAAHLASYGILLLLLVGVGSGITCFLRQWAHTRQLPGQLFAVARPVDPGPTLDPLLHALALRGRVDLVDTAIPLAFCYGLRRPRICLSTGLLAVLEPDELTALLWHEKAHLVRRDPWKVAFGRAWIRGCFFLPLAAVLYQRYLVAKEIAADAFACARLGSVAPLASALAVLLDAVDSPAWNPPGALAGGLDELALRTDWLLGQPAYVPIPRRPVVVTGLILLMLIGLELLLIQAALADDLWDLSHLALGGC